MNGKSKDNPVKEKGFAFALRIVKLNKYLKEGKGEYILSKQLLRSGTAIGALIREAEHAESKADFVHKMAIAQKEANETDYWVDLLRQSGYINEKPYQSLLADITEIQKLLTAIIVTMKKNIHNS